MIKKTTVLLIILTLIFPMVTQITISTSIPGEIYQGSENIIYRNVTVYAPAVASTDDGYVGVISTITVTIQSNGSGRVFVDTLPLTQVDMQGSARLAVKVASALVQSDVNCKVDPTKYDYFFVVRTDSPIIGGPSAGAIMTVATVSLLENWEMSNETVMTGMINPDGSIGPIGGILQKIDAAYSVGATRFLIPKGQGEYTEWVTSKETDGIWSRTTRKPVTRNVSDYAMSTYGIEVNEVAEINSALLYFTGWEIEFKGSNGIITTEDYIEAMQPLASSLIDESEVAYENATENLENANIPLYPNYRSEVNNIYENAATTLEESKEWYNKNLYYTSTSKSFQSLISSRFVNYASTFFINGQDPDYLEELIEEANFWYENASNLAKNTEIKGFISLQSTGAGQKRVSEAKLYLDTAIADYESDNPFQFDFIDFIYDIAFTIERCKSVEWWINIGTHFNDIGDISNSTLENIALEYIEEASQSAIYSRLILEEIGLTSGDSVDYLYSAESYIESARDNLDEGYSAAALFEALEALAKANLAIELLGSEPVDKIDLASESASNNIAKSREMGIEPVLAVSYYEYAESLANESSYAAALEYYKYSGMIAGALSYSNSSIGTTESRYVGIPEVNSPKQLNWFLENVALLIAVALIGGIGGLGIGLIIGSAVGSKDKNLKNKLPRSVIKYNLNHDKPQYPNNQIPRSINDYYKKNK